MFSCPRALLAVLTCAVTACADPRSSESAARPPHPNVVCPQTVHRPTGAGCPDLGAADPVGCRYKYDGWSCACVDTSPDAHACLEDDPSGASCGVPDFFPDLGVPVPAWASSRYQWRCSRAGAYCGEAVAREPGGPLASICFGPQQTIDTGP
jgi:hypothetical protein